MTRNLKKKRSDEYAFIWIGDLHVRDSTLKRCLSVLKAIEKACQKKKIQEVVITGDFWDLRGVLSVRQLHELQDVFERWESIGLTVHLIPGNHDQVAENGAIHGLRVFEPFSNIHVYTDPHLDESRKIAYVPWRETEQDEMFRAIPNGYTVFAHAEAEGATTNTQHKAPGKVTIANLDRFEAVYLGHYHKRQKLGKSTYYVGSPYQKDFGERDWPHGLGVVRKGQTPKFINLESLPKHFRLTYPDDLKLFDSVREQDIVEVYASEDVFSTDEFRESLESISAKDVRPLPRGERRYTFDKAPSFAVDIESAVATYVHQESDTTEGHADSKVKGMSVDALVKAGNDLLTSEPDTFSINALGNLVRFLEVDVKDFCAVRGEVSLPLENLGVTLLSGGMGTGKTSILDAMTWCLFGTTTPRKAGSTTSAITGDSIINDYADQAVVTVFVSVDDQPPIKIQRKKYRGQGAKIRLENAPLLEGISDQQDLINTIVGLDYKLWRSYVYLGQGAVGNFVTDADKKRKDLLSAAFKLDVCPAIQKTVRSKLKLAKADRDQSERELVDIRARYETLQSTNYDGDIKDWEEKHEAYIQEQIEVIEDAKTQVENLDSKIESEDQWLSTQSSFETYKAQLNEKIASLSGAESKLTELYSSLGAIKSEHSAFVGEFDKLKKRYVSMQSNGEKICSECGQTLDDQHVQQALLDLESKINAKTLDLKASEDRKNETLRKIEESKKQTPPELAGLRTQLAECEESLKKCASGLSMIQRAKDQRESLVKSWTRAHDEVTKKRKEKNPFFSRKKEQEKILYTHKETIEGLQTKLQEQDLQVRLLEFWDKGFGPKGIPVVALRAGLHELEYHANKFLAHLLKGRLTVRLEMLSDDLKIVFLEHPRTVAGTTQERTYLQLSGGMKRCVELAFTPFALSEMIQARTGVRIPMLFIDELTTHLDPKTKPDVVNVLHEMGRESVVVIDHDQNVQGSFDTVYETRRLANQTVSVERVR